MIDLVHELGSTGIQQLRDMLRTGQLLCSVILLYNPIKLFILLAAVSFLAGVGLVSAALLTADRAALFVSGTLCTLFGGVYLCFADATSGDETYGAGRYLLDTVKGSDLGSERDRLILDFNFAYNPSCSYDDRWACPLAPPENRLGLAIRAGERLAS